MARIISPPGRNSLQRGGFALAIGVYATLLGTLLDGALQLARVLSHEPPENQAHEELALPPAGHPNAVNTWKASRRSAWIRRLDLKESLSVASGTAAHIVSWVLAYA
jgi:hypothetical protein